MQVCLLARKRGQNLHEIPFQNDVIYLPSESLPAPLKFLVVLIFFVRLCCYPKKLRAALKSLRRVHGFRQKLQFSFRCFSLYYYQNDLMYFPFGGLAVKYLEYILETNAHVIISLRGSDINYFSFVDHSYSQRLKEALLAADGIHGVCGDILERAQELTGSTLGKAGVIFTALDEDIYKYPTIGFQENSVQEIISVGRLEWMKGLEHGMVAARALIQRGVNFRWRIIGEGEYRLPLEWAIRDMALQDKVFLAGPMKHQDVMQALLSANIFFHPSISEGVSNAVLEAMALGLPVVACDVGGMREAIPSDEVGLLVQVRNWKSMADALEKLARDPGLRARIGASASVFVRSKFTAESQAGGFLALFHRALGEEVA